MDIEGAKAFIHVLDGKIHELDLDTTIMDGIQSPQIGDTLRVLMPVTEEGHPVITEFMLMELADDYNLLMIYTTVMASIRRNKDKLPAKLIEWNLACPMGHYGIYEEENQLYHKYTLPFPSDAAPEVLAAQAMDLMGLVFELLSNHYPALEEFTAG
ncbi:MAG: hypothetical protein E7425_08460 [Ruminococcaceae bacterium]|jgi:hypothetical protein|nr:hypothetical protein [Oscillospiraceae bacterium]